MLKIAALVSGNGTNLQSIIDAINKGILNAEICCICSSNSKAYAIERAKDNLIPYKVFSIKKYSDNIKRDIAMAEYIQKNNANLIVCCGSLMTLGSEFINKFKKRIINIHPSLLPSFGGKGFFGLNVHKAVLDAGAKITGATTHFVENEIDKGRIIMQNSMPVLENDTPESLQKRLLENIEWELLIKTLKLFEIKKEIK